MTRLLSLLRSAFSVRLLTESVVIIRQPILSSPSYKRVVITRQPDLFSVPPSELSQLRTPSF